MICMNVSIHLAVKETMRAKFQLYVKRSLKEWGYPPNKQEAATQTIFQQGKLLCAEWKGATEECHDGGDFCFKLRVR